jgi:hypothetical protein
MRRRAAGETLEQIAGIAREGKAEGRAGRKSLYEEIGEGRERAGSVTLAPRIFERFLPGAVYADRQTASSAGRPGVPRGLRRHDGGFPWVHLNPTPPDAFDRNSIATPVPISPLF